jgi:hypothetical protein
MVCPQEYHRRQAEKLIRLAQTTRDPETASALMRLAAEHRLLEERASQREQDQPDMEPTVFMID